MNASTPSFLYIAGLPHCGSTYLSQVLNQHSQVFSAGELEDLHLIEKPDNQACSCVVSHPNRDACAFWTRVRHRLREESIGLRDIARVSHDRRQEWIRALTGLHDNREETDFVRGNRRLLDVLGEESEASVIVDSSKTLWRLLPLVRGMPERLHILFLKRRPEDQIASRLNRDHGFLRSALLKYLRKHCLYRYFFGSHPRFTELSFETFIRQPDRTLASLFEGLDLETEPVWDRPMAPFHHLRGNHRVRSRNHLPKPDPDRLIKQHPYSGWQKLLLAILERISY